MPRTRPRRHPIAARRVHPGRRRGRTLHYIATCHHPATARTLLRGDWHTVGFQARTLIGEWVKADWDDLPDWQRATDSDIFDRIGQDV